MKYDEFILIWPKKKFKLTQPNKEMIEFNYKPVYNPEMTEFSYKPVWYTIM